MEKMHAHTNGELQDMISRMFEADHPIFSIVATKVTHWDKLLIPFVVPDLEPVYKADCIRIHAARAAVLTVANVTSWKWKAGGRSDSDFLMDMRFTPARSKRVQFTLEGMWSRLEAAISAPKARLDIGDEIRSYWRAFEEGSGDNTWYGCMSDIVEQAREEGIELPD